jgi:hypothetical protein
MNKKLATLLFAIGVGAASASAMAGPCEYWCHYGRTSCLNSPGIDPATCDENYLNCMADCPSSM